MATDAKSSSKNGVTLTTGEALLLRLAVRHMHKCHTSGSSVEPSSKQSSSVLVSNREREMLYKFLPKLKIEKDSKSKKYKVAFTTLIKLADALTSKMTGESVVYEDTGYDEEDVCADYVTSLANQ